jgi:hypothetical protein
MVSVYRMDPGDIHVPESVIAGRLGFKGQKAIPDRFRASYHRAMEELIGASKPEALFDTTEVVPGGNTVVIGDHEMTGELIQKHLSGTDHATLLLATLGLGVDRIIDEKGREGDTVASFFTDGIASEMVEFFVRELDMILRRENPEMAGGTRISPGYGDLSLEHNRWMVEVLGGEAIGISVVEGSFQMIPRKSISAILGWREIGHGQE